MTKAVQPIPTTDSCIYGQWTHDEAGLPCFDLNPLAGPEFDAPLRHLLSTGRLSGLANRWGGLSLFTTDGGHGFENFAANPWRYRSPAYGQLFLGDDLVSLSAWEMGPHRSVRYGVGYARYQGIVTCAGGRISVDQAFVATLNHDSGFRIALRIENLGPQAICGVLRMAGDLSSNSKQQIAASRPTLAPGLASISLDHPTLGDIGIVAEDAWAPGWQFSRLFVDHPINLEPGAAFEAKVWVGYGNPIDIAAARESLEGNILENAQRDWRDRLSVIDLPSAEPWIRDECVWSTGQLLSFTGFDGATQHSYSALGGYGWRGFGVREAAENSLALAEHYPELAKETLRWVACLQYHNGNLARGYNFVPRTSPAEQMPDESDNELWFLLGCVHFAESSRDPSFLDEVCPYADAAHETIWEHLCRAFYWIRDKVGVGTHGLLRFWNGDWNDYLCNVGRAGLGESVMNTGIACRTMRMFAIQARLRNDPIAIEVEEFYQRLMNAMAGTFDQTHFIRGYTDSGKPFGTHTEDRVYLNAQTWAVLGGCGTELQRQTALLHAIAKCASPIGLTLMSRPLPCPPPYELAQSPAPPGEGENAGIWPQTVYWLAWALAESGMTTEAADVWKRMSLRNHMRVFPAVPFGIYNGPDCYSSHHAGPERAGRTQIEPVSRADHSPMVCSVAWQSFVATKIWK